MGADRQPAGREPDRLYVDDSDLEYSEFAHYDLGQAVAHLDFQAQRSVWQCTNSARSTATGSPQSSTFPKAWEVTTLAAIGVPAAGTDELTGAGTSRDRLAVDDILWPFD